TEYTLGVVNGEVLSLAMFLASVAFVLGLADDLKRCRPVTKLIVQVLLGIATIACVGIVYGLPLVLTVPATIFGVVGLMNAVNIMDNMDGTASGLLVLAMIGYALLGVLTNNLTVVLLSVTVAGASFGFLLHNKPPARIFMGDAGSLMLGYFLAVTGILVTHGVYQYKAVRLVVPLLIVGLFLTDTAFVVVWRKFHSQPIARGDKNHLSHRLAKWFRGSEWKANGVLYGFQVFLIVLAFGSTVTALWVSFLLFLIGLGSLLGLSWRLWRVT
ncbi:MAG: undecaprenyl/decaprenyl-phosphate alpha-N-acetylglucosaminyl 1-phosphate transferase, partial [Candidatus Latescibacteria bacterium]|nr:undecaprenyl/decaprenyl-phosphate alpha-N-acetylglucosaminyl 1-phosphate transferase [Candidatus Latescibacterota bacterium]